MIMPHWYFNWSWLAGRTGVDKVGANRSPCAIKKRIIVGAICNAASSLPTWFLNEINIRENGLKQLQLWGGGNYTNKAGYMNEQAVSDKRIVTANGTGYLEFAKELLLLLENDTPEQIEMFYCFNKEGLQSWPSQLP